MFMKMPTAGNGGGSEPINSKMGVFPTGTKATIDLGFRPNYIVIVGIDDTYPSYELWTEEKGIVYKIQRTNGTWSNLASNRRTISVADDGFTLDDGQFPIGGLLYFASRYE